MDAAGIVRLSSLALALSSDTIRVVLDGPRTRTDQTLYFAAYLLLGMPVELRLGTLVPSQHTHDFLNFVAESTQKYWIRRRRFGIGREPAAGQSRNAASALFKCRLPTLLLGGLAQSLSLRVLPVFVLGNQKAAGTTNVPLGFGSVRFIPFCPVQSRARLTCIRRF